MGHEGHESHEQHAFTSPYPCGVAGLVKKRAVSGCAGTPLFSTTYARCQLERTCNLNNTRIAQGFFPRRNGHEHNYTLGATQVLVQCFGALFIA